MTTQSLLTFAKTFWKKLPIGSTATSHFNTHKMDIQNWVTRIIKGIGGFLSWEDHEMPTYHNTREEQIAAFVLRCLANPDCEGSRKVLDAIMERRGEAVPDYGTGFRPPWDVIDEKYICCAIDESGKIYLYQKKAKITSAKVWVSEHLPHPFAFSVKGPVKNWRECLWIRPGHQQQ